MESIGLINLAILAGAVFVLLGIVSSLVANRFGAPLLFVFLVVGMLVGQDGPGGVVFNDYSLAYFIGSLALAIILFDGGLRTRLALARAAVAPAVVLATIGVVLTAAFTAVIAGVVLDLGVVESLLFGGMVASTDAAAVFFLLRAGGMRLQPPVGEVLEMESATNDPMAVMITVILAQWLLASGSGESGLYILTFFLRQAVLGAALGLAGGLLAAWALNRIAMPGGLHPLFAAALAVFVFALTSTLGGSGFLAVYLAGLVLANRPVRAYPSILAFHDAATWLCQIVMFLVLGLLVTPTTLISYALPGMAVSLFLMIVARPLAVWLCLLPFNFGRKETFYTSWVGLRGAVSIFLATIPTLAGVPHAEAYFNVAFFVVLTSLLMQGGSLAWLASRLGLALKRNVAAVKRIEFDIPGQTQREMVGYPVAHDSLVLALKRLPSWARLTLIVRDGEVLEDNSTAALQAGDYAYFLVPSQRVMRLDQLFAGSPLTSRRLGPLFGELSVNGDASIEEISKLYDLEAVVETAGPTVSAFFERYLKDTPQVGQRLPLGRGWLVARVVEGGRVTRAGLQLEELMGSWLKTMRTPEHMPWLARQTRSLSRLFRG
jgi:cell volume regulation protein A